MRKIVVGAQVSMDGVMQAPGGPWEDPTQGFKFGGWVRPYFDPVFGEEIDRVFKETCDLLLAGFGAAPEPSANGFLPPPSTTGSAARLHADELARLEHGPRDCALRTCRRHQDRRYRARCTERR